MTLTDFLLARIAEDEAAAHRFDADLAREFGTPAESLLSSELTLAGSGYMDYPVLTVDSTRVLAECEAKRRIVEKLERRWDEADAAAEDPNLSVRERGSMNRMYSSQATGLASAVRALAEVYADHPDYREEWRP